MSSCWLKRLALGFVALLPFAAAQAGDSPPSLSQEQIDRSAKEAIASANEQPTKLVLVGGEIGWVKYCEAQGDRCILVRGFAPGPIYPSKLQLTIETAKQNDLYRVRVLLPLNLQLDAGFAVTFGTPTGYVGTYKLCSTLGCFGDVFLPQSAFDAMKQAKVVNVIVKTDAGRTVTVEGPMEGFTAAFDRAPDKLEEVMAREADINKRLAAEIDANRAAREAAEKAAPDKGAPVAGATSTPAPGAAAR